MSSTGFFRTVPVTGGFGVVITGFGVVFTGAGDEVVTGVAVGGATVGFDAVALVDRSIVGTVDVSTVGAVTVGAVTVGVAGVDAAALTVVVGWGFGVSSGACFKSRTASTTAAIAMSAAGMARVHAGRPLGRVVGTVGAELLLAYCAAANAGGSWCAAAHGDAPGCC